MKTFLGTVVALLLAAAPGFGQQAVDPAQVAPFEVTPAAGPWLICVDSFTGEGSGKLAFQLVQEIRLTHRLPAYIFNRGEKERRRQNDELQKRRQAQIQALRKEGLPTDIPFRTRKVRIEDQYAVLVGGYPDMDAAARALKDVKRLPPPKSVPPQGVVELKDRDNETAKLQGAAGNPFANAFVVRNPTVPASTEKNAPDPFLKELNANESFSLLKCKQPWTLAIKIYQGATVIQPRNAPTGFMEKLFGGKGAQLNACEINAHNMADALRKSKELREMGVDAYVLHTRTHSVVTVGAFASKDDPKMAQVQRFLAKWQLNRDPKDPNGSKAMAPSALQLLPEPLPMEVPRL